MKHILKFIYIPPVYHYLILIYALTKVIEWSFGTENFWPYFWNLFSEYLENNKFITVVFIIPLGYNSMFWINATLFYALSYLKCMEKYKIQTAKTKMTRKYWNHLMVTLVINQAVVGPMYQATVYYAIKKLNLLHLINFKYIPSFPELFLNVALAMILYEIIFFYTHWTLHRPLIYKYIHKLHHRYVTPFSYATIYQHPVEYVLCDLVTVTLPYMILRMDMPSLFVFAIFIQFTTVFEHCGYNIPFLLSPEVHDYHHAHFNECYSTNGILDYLHGTCENFLKSERFEKHKIFS